MDMPVAEAPAETPIEAPVEAPAPNTSQLESLVKKYMPDADMTDPVAAATQLLTRLSSIHDKLYDIVDEYPEFGQALSAMMKGMSPNEAIARYLDIEEAPEGAPDFDKMTEAKAERKKEKETRVKTLQENEQFSIKSLEDFKATAGVDDATAQDMMDKVYKIYLDIKDVKISPETLMLLWKGINADNEIKKAKEEGEIAGRNAQIEKKRTSPETGDGIPKLSNNGTPAKSRPEGFGSKFMKGVI